MITIKDTSKDLSKVEKYLLTVSSNIHSVKDLSDGDKLSVKCWCRYTDTKSSGEEVELVSIMCQDNEVYATQSRTFIGSLFAIDEIMGGEPYTIIKKSGITKSGRDFIDCVLDISEMAI